MPLTVLWEVQIDKTRTPFESETEAPHKHKDYIMSAKTPFEIRLQLLELAQSILNDQNWTERSRLENDWNTAREIVLTTKKGKVPSAPKLPVVSEDDIILLAKRLNEFVSNGN